jgi:hypothetical protein
MKDPQRLLEHGASETELTLLRAGAFEEPSTAARQRLLASLGLSGALASATLAQSAVAQGGAQTAAAGAGGGALKLVAAKLGVKGLVLALGSASLVGGVWVAKQLPARHPAERASVPAAAARAPVHQAALEPPAQPAAVEATPASISSSAPGRAATLAGEIARLDQARRLLRGGDASAAALVLDQYAAEAPLGALRQEADVLRIDVFWQLGELEQARRLSRAFLGTYRASPHAERVRARLVEARPRAREPKTAPGRPAR